MFDSKFYKKFIIAYIILQVVEWIVFRFGGMSQLSFILLSLVNVLGVITSKIQIHQLKNS